MDRPCFVNSVTTPLSALTISTPPASVQRTTATTTTLPTVLPPTQKPIMSAPNLHLELLPVFSTTGHLGDNAVGKGDGTVIVLFRADLRLDDHPALSHALEEAAHIIPVYVFDPRHFGRTAFGFEKTGKYRANFLLESVSDLRAALQKKGSDLIVRIGEPETVIPDLCKRVGAKEVYLHGEVTYEQQEVEDALATALKKNGKTLRLFWASTLYHEDGLPFDIHSMPDVYSDFRESVEKHGTIRTPLPPPETLPQLPRSLRPGDIPTLATLGIRDTPKNLEYPGSAAKGVSAVIGGETEAIERVRGYVNDVKRVEANGPRARSTTHLGADFSCRISPWLALGCISPRRIFVELKKVSTNHELLLRSPTYYELVWRDFFRCITTKYSRKRCAARRGVAEKSLARA